MGATLRKVRLLTTLTLPANPDDFSPSSPQHQKRDTRWVDQKSEGWALRFGRFAYSRRSPFRRTRMTSHHRHPNIKKGIPGGYPFFDGRARGIRTLEPFYRLHDFQSCSFDHSDIALRERLLLWHMKNSLRDCRERLNEPTTRAVPSRAWLIG